MTGSADRADSFPRFGDSRHQGATAGIRRRLAARGMRAARRQEATIFAVMIGLVTIFTIAKPANFATSGNIENLAKDASILAVLSVGTTFITVMGVFDLSIGSVLVFAQVASVKVMGSMGGNDIDTALASLAAAVIAGAAWGLVNGFLVARLDLSPFIVTLATLGAALGAAQLLSDGNDLTEVPASLNNALGLDTTLGVSNLVLIMIVIALTGGLVLARTRFGAWTYAIGSNRQAARRAGIPVGRHMITVYALMGVLAGIAGYLAEARFGTTNINGHGSDALAAITAVALGGASLYGGTGTMFGTIVGVCIPSLLQNGLVIMGTQPYWYQVIVAAALVASIYLDRRRRARQYR